MNDRLFSQDSGISYRFIKTDRFKTTVISLGFYLKTDKTAAANSLALSLLRSGTKELPDPYSFQRKLASLYGANASSWTAKQGDISEYRININVNADRYSLCGEKTVNEAGKLFCDMIFGRFLEGSNYPDDAFEREKRLLTERIEGKMNDKRIYARSRCEQEMCKNEPFGMSPDGTADEAAALTPSDVKKALRRLIRTSFVSVIIIGEAEPDGFEAELARLFAAAGREYSPIAGSIMTEAAGKVTFKDEKMPVEQGKLVIGLRSTSGGGDRETAAFRVMADIFGGGPYSKLFCNVREKMSLCYYCSARPVFKKGIIFVESGVEKKNMDAAFKAISEQFEDMKKGLFTEKELNFSKLALCDAMRSAESDQQALLSWYCNRAVLPEVLPPDKVCEEIEKVTVADVAAAAAKFGIDTVYRLIPASESEGDL